MLDPARGETVRFRVVTPCWQRMGLTPVVALRVLLYANSASGEEAGLVVLLVIAINLDVLFQGFD